MLKMNRPWDARCAAALVRPLLGTRVRPNHLTFLRLVVGLVGVVLIAGEGHTRIVIGMCLVALSNFIDHTDGALARMGHYVSRFGHLFDLTADAIVTVLLFVAVGFGLPDGRDMAGFAPLVGLVAGLSVAAIFYMRMQIEDQQGKAGTKQPQWAGFELEDILYLMPLVPILGALEPFLIAAAVVTPLCALWVLRDYLHVHDGRAMDTGSGQ